MASRTTRRRAVSVLALALVLGVGAGLAAWALGRPSTDQPPTLPEAAPSTTDAPPATEREPAPVLAASGERLYAEAGCGACHGLTGEGTDVGPALGGHSADQVRRQVRAPLVQMPAYSEEQLSEADLTLIADHIESLAPMMEHVEPVKLPEVLALHHWMALSAIGSESLDDAAHHLGHILDNVEGEHREAMLRAEALLRRGDLDEAQHLIEGMLAGKADPKLTLAQLNLRLALAAIDRRDEAEAVHQLEHYVTRARGADLDKGKAALADLREGDLHGAEHGIAGLLGVDRD